MENESSKPMILLHHDDDLCDARDLLIDLGVDFVERRGDLCDEDRSAQWNLIIAPQRRTAAYQKPAAGKLGGLVRIAIVDSDSRTLRAMLRRQGADYIIARPVHSLAFRLLLLHVLYRGPERRSLARVSVGAPITIKAGMLSKHEALLADLSPRGARVTTQAKLRSGRKIQLVIPPELSESKPYNLPGRILRISEDAESPGSSILAIEFTRLSPGQGKKLRATFEHYQCGPARIRKGDPGVLPHKSSEAPITSTASNTDAPTPVGDGERRGAVRHEYDRRVIALDEDRTRVLICRDISMGGMRVEPNNSVLPGDEFRVALHVESRTEPLVVTTRVTRDDGEEGLVLSFEELSQAAESYLGKLVQSLPGSPGDGDPGRLFPEFIVSEILEGPQG